MRVRFLLPPLGLALSLGVLAAAPAPEPAEKPDAATINRLIAQLGGDDFDQHKKAGAALEAIGEPALGVLREAVNSTDAGVGERAETLVRTIEKRLEAEVLQRTRRVHLHFKDTPLKDAVEAFRKESGYDLALNVPDDKVKDRTVTLDADNAPFWQAFDSFCEKAGLREADVQDLVALRPSYSNSPAGARIAVERIMLTDGKPEGGAADASSVVRIRALKQPKPPAPADDDDIPVALLLSLEPRLQWLSIEEVTIDKAVDNEAQELGATGKDVIPSNPKQKLLVILPDDGEFMGGGVYREAIVHFGKGPKAARSLAELRGTIRATILGEMSAVISVPDVLKAAGRTFKGGEDGLLKVIDAWKDQNGKVTIRMELRSPDEFVPPNGRGVPRGVAAGLAAEPDGRLMGPGLGRAFTNSDGIGLMDDKGNNIEVTGGGIVVSGATLPGRRLPEGGWLNRFIQIVSFQTNKGQEPSKLVYCGRKIMTVEIPFTLKDVPLP